MYAEQADIYIILHKVCHMQGSNNNLKRSWLMLEYYSEIWPTLADKLNERATDLTMRNQGKYISENESKRRITQ